MLNSFSTGQAPDTFEQMFRVHGRFLNSTHLERDWNDPQALHSYALSSHARDNLKRLSEGLRPTSGQRAWRVTGDYGSGKSSFALLLAHGFSARRADLPQPLRAAFESDEAVPQLLPVLVTGAREPLRVALLRALARTLDSVTGRGRAPKVRGDVAGALGRVDSDAAPTDGDVLELLQSTQRFAVESGRAGGLLLILDEMGKFLEFAALHPQRQDVFLLQQLAEAAARSGPQPLFVVGLLHQGFTAYAEGLPRQGQQEWEKVAGRYQELTWSQPVEQIAHLVADALNVRQESVALDARADAARDMAQALRLRWYGAAPSGELQTLAPRLFPLHPTVLPPLVRAFARFGQNERSLFQFLLGHEPFGLRDFVERTGGSEFFRLSDLWGYLRFSFGARLHQQSYRTHWGALEAVVESHYGEDPLEEQLLQSVAMLNALGAEDLLPTAELLALAVRGTQAGAQSEVEAKLQRLRGRHLLHFRGVAGGYSVWPHTSVNLENRYEAARNALNKTVRVAPLLVSQLETRPLVARRHYIETGNLRHFEVVYCAVEELRARCLETPIYDGRQSDGRILVPLCETPAETATALEIARDAEWEGEDYKHLLFAIPHPLNGLAGALDEVRAWEWIEHHTPGLEQDRYASEEVSRQRQSAARLLQDSIENAVGLTSSTGSGLRWFYRGREQSVRTGSQILGLLSKICDDVFPNAPKIKNELLNRRTLSSAASAARMRLIERVLETSTLPLLGMDENKKPPEMSMYLSVLRYANVHTLVDAEKPQGDWTIALPSPAKDEELAHLRPSLNRIHEILAVAAEARILVTHIMEELRRPPYGVRDGLAGLLLAVFTTINEGDLAFYEDGNFIPRMTGSIFVRLIKAPETFEMQLFPVSGVRVELFRRLARSLHPQREVTHHVDILDVVRPLASFGAALPVYTAKTKQLSPRALAVRDVLIDAREPSTLLFHDLPVACELEPFAARDEAQVGAKSNASGERVEVFAQALKSALDELRGAYPALLQRMLKMLQQRLDLDGTFAEMQKALAPRAQSLAGVARESRFKSFCLRLGDTALPQEPWLESLGSLVCAQPPARWRDNDADKYAGEIDALCGQFTRVEATILGAAAFGERQGADGEAIRVSLTRHDGQEQDRIVYLSGDESIEVEAIEAQLAELLQRHGRVGLAATSRALWKAMENNR